jgi:hypothetical protein
MKKNEDLRKKMLQNDGNAAKSNEILKSQVEKMRAEMVRVNNYSIDMANNPAEAIENISNPILEKLNMQIIKYE